jgi:hypothetical protein
MMELRDLFHTPIGRPIMRSQTKSIILAVVLIDLIFGGAYWYYESVYMSPTNQLKRALGS